MKKTIVAVALVLIFVLALAAPAFAMVHVGVIKVNGNVMLNKEVGHKCNTGGVQTQSIRGNGELTKDFNIAMVKGKLTVKDMNDFVSAAGTTAPLTINSVISLCTPPKYTYKGLYGDDLGKVAPVSALYSGTDAMPATWDGEKFVGTTVEWLAKAGSWTPLTTQTWAALVRADAGFSGKLHQDFEAAYGPYSGKTLDAEGVGGSATTWSWNTLGAAAPGVRFVGDYFKMNQTARTSQGFVGRYIDMSSPWSGAYLYEDSEMTGFVEIVENFNMTNIVAGADVPGKWWKNLFVKR